MLKILQARSKKGIMDHFRVRGQVFILEQAVSWEEEFDSWDDSATHFNAILNGVVVGAARLYKNKVGRVAVLSPYRTLGIGKALMQTIERHAKKQGIKTLELGAQIQVQGFYERLGYEPYGERFMDANIEHIMMRKKVNHGH